MFRALQFRLEGLTAATRAATLRLGGINVGAGCRVAAGARVARTWLGRGCGTIVLGDSCDIRRNVVIESWGGDIRCGRNVFIGPHAVIYGHGGVEIGDDVLISMHVCVLSSNHGIPRHGRTIRSEPDVLRRTQIGRDVWIGAGAVILGGVTIGDGCVIGAGAVVTKPLPSHAIAYGVPAAVRGYRADA
ncbi:MAG: acyltransferase [Opitutaceae bacterium]|nr:acyltransferase [Opitutaceae bacterium]